MRLAMKVLTLGGVPAMRKSMLPTIIMLNIEPMPNPPDDEEAAGAAIGGGCRLDFGTVRR